MKGCSICHVDQLETAYPFKGKGLGRRAECRSCATRRRMACYYKNHTHYREVRKNWYERNKERLKGKRVSRTEYRRGYEKARYHSEPEFRLRRRLRSAVREALAAKQENWKVLLGCSVGEARDFLEKHFDENMSWENQGSYWHIDHVIPISAWNLSNQGERVGCFHYTNIQPLEATKNLIKSGTNRVPRGFYDAAIKERLMVLRALEVF